MTTPPPPWAANSPLPEDEFGTADRTRFDDDDEVTAPIRVAPPADVTTTVFSSSSAPTQMADTGGAPTEAVAVPPAESIHRQETAFAAIPIGYPPPRPEDTYTGRFTAPLSVDPRSVPLKTNNFQPAILAAAGIAAVILLALAAWWLWPSGGDGEVVAEQSSSTPVIDAEGHDKLMSLLPSGYPAEACTAGEPPDGAVAVVNCTRNVDAGGPASATYTLMRDAAALNAAIEKTISEARVVNCPGRIQSPGPWRRNASPQTIAGTLVCGMADKQGMVAWTTDSALLLNVTRADPEGPTLDQLFTWWQSHS